MLGFLFVCGFLLFVGFLYQLYTVLLFLAPFSKLSQFAFNVRHKRILTCFCVTVNKAEQN